MSDQTDIDALLRDLTAYRYRTVLLSREECARHHAALTALVAERDSLRAELAAANRRIDELEAPIRNPLSSALELKQALAAMRKEGGGA